MWLVLMIVDAYSAVFVSYPVYTCALLIYVKLYVMFDQVLTKVSLHTFDSSNPSLRRSHLMALGLCIVVVMSYIHAKIIIVFL